MYIEGVYTLHYDIDMFFTIFFSSVISEDVVQQVCDTMMRLYNDEGTHTVIRFMSG